MQSRTYQDTSNFLYQSTINPIVWEMDICPVFDEQEMAPVQSSKKGLILELFQVQTSAAVSWQKFLLWVYTYTLFGEPPPTERGQALRKLVVGLKTKRQYLHKSTAKREDLERFLNEPFILPTHTIYVLLSIPVQLYHPNHG